MSINSYVSSEEAEASWSKEDGEENYYERNKSILALFSNWALAIAVNGIAVAVGFLHVDLVGDGVVGCERQKNREYNNETDRKNYLKLIFTQNS